MADDVMRKLAEDHLLISCEGSAEEVIINKLIEGRSLVFPKEHVIAVTRKRKAAEIQDEFLNYDYDWPVSVVRIHDSRKEAFKLGNLYRDRYAVIDVITHPEIDVLAVLRENKWEHWKKTGKKPSEYCKSELRMADIKRTRFLEEYWDVDGIVSASREYRRMSQLRKGELCLADILR